MTLELVVARFVPPFEGPRVEAVLLAFPPGFVNADGEIYNLPEGKGNAFPLQGQPERGPGFLRLVRDVSAAIPEGTLQIIFPVTTPRALPTFNVWFLGWCEEGDASVCNLEEGAEMLTNFALLGFPYGVEDDRAFDPATLSGASVAALAAMLITQF